MSASGTFRQFDSHLMFIDPGGKSFVLGFCVSFIFKFHFLRNSFPLCLTKVYIGLGQVGKQNRLVLPHRWLKEWVSSLVN